MKNYIFVIIFLLLANQLPGQIPVTFRLNIQELKEKGLFSYDAGDRVFIRGSFNNWEGTDYELKRADNPDIFSGVFEMDNPGDTISYKFLLSKGKNKFFWEANPNPDNPDHGNRQLIIDKQDMVLAPVPFNYDEYISYPVIFTENKLKEDYLQFRNILESTHPALYDYTPKKVLDSIFNHNLKQINSDLDFQTFLILMSEVISKVGCGHSSLWVPAEFWNVAPEKLFPLKLHIIDHKLLVGGSFSNTQDIPLGSEILSINKQPVDSIINRLAALTSADGFNTSYRQTKVAQHFSVKYAYAFGFPDIFFVEYLMPGSEQKSQKIIYPVSKELVDKGNPERSELSYKQIGGTKTGVLTINTFAYYTRVDMFHGFIDSVFREIDRNKVKNLVLDLRGNGGGDPFCAAYLWGYLQPKPLPYFEDRYGKYDTLADPIPKPKNNFKGNLYTLIDGNGFSTTGHFCGLLKYHHVGTFIGSELGATYTCTGNATYPSLKNTGIMVGTARVRRYTAAVKDMDPMRGVMPDYPVQLTPDDIIEGRDAAMEFALSLINAKR